MSCFKDEVARLTE